MNLPESPSASAEAVTFAGISCPSIKEKITVTTRSDYSDEEWKNIKAAPLLAGLWVSTAASSGPIDTAKEALAISHSLEELVKKGSDSELIATLIDEIKPKEGEAVQSREGIALNVKTPQELHKATMDTLQAANAALTKATPVESAEFKLFVMTVCQRVAEAGKEGGFLGVGGTRISPAETKAIEEIRTALGATQ
jgi:hypothetical protein